VEVLLKTENALIQEPGWMCFMHSGAPVRSERKKQARTVLMRPFESGWINPYLYHSDVFDLLLIQASLLFTFRLCIPVLLKTHTRPQKLAPAPTS